MESNAMTWNEVAASIIDDDRGKWDRKVSAEQVWVSQSGTLIAMNGGPAPGRAPIRSACQIWQRPSCANAWRSRLRTTAGCRRR